MSDYPATFADRREARIKELEAEVKRMRREIDAHIAEEVVRIQQGRDAVAEYEKRITGLEGKNAELTGLLACAEERDRMRAWVTEGANNAT